MSTLVQHSPVATATLRPSLLRAEALRLTSRRMVRVLLALAVVGFLAGVAIASTQYAKPSAAVLAEAEENRQRILSEQAGYREECLRAVGTPNGPPTAVGCGEPLTAEQLGPVDSFIERPPFRVDGDGLNGVVGVAAATAALAYLLGASYVGAEWSSRSMVALLFWEPRRPRVMAAKLVVLTGAAALIGLAAQAAWLIAAGVLAATRGTGGGSVLQADLLGAAGRGVAFVVLAALLGFGIANLVRNTGAALGFGFLYFAIVENVVRGLRPSWQPWLLTENAVALLSNGGLRLFLNEGFVDQRGVYQSTGREVLVSNLHGGLVWAAVTAVIVTVGVVLFARRDLS